MKRLVSLLLSVCLIIGSSCAVFADGRAVSGKMILNQNMYMNSEALYEFVPSNSSKYELNVLSGKARQLDIYDDIELLTSSYSSDHFLTDTLEGGKKYYFSILSSGPVAVILKPYCSRNDHSWDAGVVTKPATCRAKGVKTYTCVNCGSTRKEAIPIDANAHDWKETVQPATVLSEGKKVLSCECGQTKTEVIPKLPATLSVNTNSIVLKVKQKTSAVKVSNLASGDSVDSVISKNPKVAKVSVQGNDFTIKGAKAGSTSVTITLKSGKTAVVKVKVQKTAVKTKKITGVQKQYSMKVNESLTITPVLVPITSSEKITFSSSNKKIVTVSKTGVVKAKKAGKAVVTVKSGSKKVKATIIVN